MPGQYDNPDEILDIGSSLKKEKTRKENAEKVAQLKEQYQKEQEKEQQKQEKEKSDGKNGFSHFLTKHKTVLFLLIILLVATGLRLYVASKPITDDWAEQVVTANLETQVKNKVYEEYPTLSDAKKAELVQQGVSQALAAEQNQQAIETLSEQYKESYKDPEGNSYLYEIDPYYFYELAVKEQITREKYPYPLLPFVEYWFYKIVAFFLPSVSFVRVIFYLPLLFTLFSAIFIFFIAKELWNETAAFLAGLFFVTQPILLEFSLLGFVDTNMLNIFFIVASGFLFLSFFKQIAKTYNFEMNNQMREYTFKYLFSFFLLVLLGISILLFRLVWSAWYISVLLLIVPLSCFALLWYSKKLWYWKEQSLQTKKYVLLGAFLFLGVLTFFFYYSFQEVEVGGIEEIQIKSYLPTSVKKYLHFDYVDPYGNWPDTFALIKELQTTPIPDLIKYAGGKVVILTSFLVFLSLAWSILKTKEKREELNKIYLLVAYLVFAVLSLRAIRLLPYFIPFLAITVGIGITLVFEFLKEKMQQFLHKEKKAIRMITLTALWCIVFLPFAYSLVPQILEKSNLMPIMDDAIYNSAIFIKENSNADAIISTWWDRGTFYKALAERTVHLQSQPHMPRTYWLASFYITDDEVEAKNIISMLDCQAEPDIFSSLQRNFSQQESIEIMKELLQYEENERNQSLEKILAPLNQTVLSDNPILVENIRETLSSKLSCDKAAAETYIVVIDDIMLKFSAVQYFAAWDFAAQQPDPQYPYMDLEEGSCLRSQSGLYCGIGRNQFFLNLTSMNVTATTSVNEVYLVANETVQHNVLSDPVVTANPYTLLIYNRAGYWKALYLPKEVADSMYVQLMILDGYNLTYFEKVFDEVRPETAGVKVYKVKWNGTETTESS